MRAPSGARLASGLPRRSSHRRTAAEPEAKRSVASPTETFLHSVPTVRGSARERIGPVRASLLPQFLAFVSEFPDAL
jgi:hypothetical protein